MAFAKLCIAAVLIALASATPVTNTNEAREARELSLEDTIASYIQSQDIEFEFPGVGSTVTLGARNLNEDEIDLKVKLSGGEARKSSKLKKIFAPILILVILKAITLIPLALGVLGLKAWNAIQLSFVTFVISIGLAVFELCKKIAADHVHPVVTHSAPWQAARSMPVEGAQEMAYSAHL